MNTLLLAIINFISPKVFSNIDLCVILTQRGILPIIGYLRL